MERTARKGKKIVNLTKHIVEKQCNIASTKSKVRRRIIIIVKTVIIIIIVVVIIIIIIIN
jgi:lipopolysaccharide/colanic/teichoic acid biosynthesis glycosyltransferase